MKHPHSRLRLVGSLVALATISALILTLLLPTTDARAPRFKRPGATPVRLVPMRLVQMWFKPSSRRKRLPTSGAPAANSSYHVEGITDLPSSTLNLTLFDQGGSVLGKPGAPNYDHRWRGTDAPGRTSMAAD